MLVAAAIALIAGVVSFASPCCLPLVPGYLSYMTGLSGQDLAEPDAAARSRMFVGSILFVVGFAVPFTMLGVAFAQLSFLQQNVYARITMGLIVAGLGLMLATGRSPGEWRLTQRAPDGGLATAPVLGFVFGVGWTPCIGPALGAIMTLSVSVDTTSATLRGGTLGFVYALGVGVPFIVIGLLFHRAAGAMAFLKRNGRRLQVAGGALLILVGVAISTGLWDRFITVLRPSIQGWTPPI
ncbi:MAG: cytochrome c biogenesis protein CcdA [Actinobacteria bacterium]|nr:cytochrome c biogenesis protein CcdA [Actinomycetota bacterium]